MMCIEYICNDNDWYILQKERLTWIDWDENEFVRINYKIWYMKIYNIMIILIKYNGNGNR